MFGMFNLLAQTVYDPNASWMDTPRIFQTPRQRMEMFAPVVHYGWPIIVIAIGFMIISNMICEEPFNRNPRWRMNWDFLIWTGFFFGCAVMVFGLWGCYHVFF